MGVISFIVPGQPQGKGRPRFAKRGAFVQTYNPEKTVSYEGLIQQHFMATRAKPIQGSCTVEIQACYQIPKSTSKKKQALMASGQIKPTTKPDIDNICKIICDALNTLAYKDDSQVTTLYIKKIYSETPHVFVRITPHDEQAL